MRIFTKHTPAASMVPMPFDGLGFAMESVQMAACEMSLVFHRQCDDEGVNIPASAYGWQPSGYKLLVTLSREIRGR